MHVKRPVFIYSLVAIIAALAVAAACGGGGSSATPTPTPTPTQQIVTPGPTAAPPLTDYLMVFQESKPTEDVIWSLSPADVTKKTALATIPHREGFPVRAALSPDGTFLAYLTLPDFALSADSSQAEAYVIDLKTNETTKLADGVDYNYTPLWAPDSGLLYMRRYAGPEFLNATVFVVRVRIVHKPGPDEPTLTPTPTPQPGIAPWPGFDPVEVVLQATVANVLRFSPLGFADDSKSMFFIEEEGGTEGATLVGIYAPATTAEVDKLHDTAEAAWYAAQAANKAAADAAAANGQPPPVDTVTPAPTPAPDSRFVVQLSEQGISGASLSPDMHHIAYLSQSISEDGELLNQTYLSDLIAATAAPLPLTGLSVGNHLNPVWYPDGRLTVGVLPATGGPGQLAIVALDLSNVYLLPQPDSGFDVPRGWAPDGTWLAVSHQSGASLANPGEASLDLVSVNGQRVNILSGPSVAGEDSVMGWTKPPAATPPS
jgi:hypothetical protein